MKCSHQPRPCLSGQCPPGQQLRRLAHARTGFALVLTLAMMVLLIVVAVGLLGLSTISIKVSTLGSAQDRARANAQMALMIALGQLQENAGPDRRISGNGKLAGGLPQNPHWTGIWSSNPDDMLPVWLVSGNEGYGLEQLNAADDYPVAYFTPGQQPDGNWFTFHSSTLPGEPVSVPTVPIIENDAIAGRYAWWVSDEGTKARVDVTAPSTAPANDAEQIARSLSPQENGIQHLDPLLTRLSPLSDPSEMVDKRRIVSVNTIDLLNPVSDADALSHKFFHDLTTGGYGLPVNVVTGGMKTDLSIAFDSSQSTRGYDEEIIGATPVLVTNGQNPRYDAVFNFSPVSEPETFYLIPELLDKNLEPIGPNWGILYNYCQLWRNITESGSISGINLDPDLESDLRNREWPPYHKSGSGNLRSDRQHTNSPVTPVLSMLQIGFRLSSAKNSDTDDYRLQLQVKPVIGIWNPYNITIEPALYNVRWGLYPYLRIGINPPDGDAYYTRTWMRTLWEKGGQAPDPDDPEADVFLWLKTKNLTDLQPGEFRLFSIDGTKSLQKSNNLVPTWSEDGSFIFKLVDQTNPGIPPSVIVPPDSEVWYEDLMLEDLQHTDTWTRFFADDARDWQTASWVSFNNGNGEIHRISDFWQKPLSTERDLLPYKVPEPIGGTGAPASPRVRVEDITSSGSPLHIGSWRWFSRNSTDAEAPQRLRGWVDTNPRFAPANPLWDGSRPAGSDGYKGWHFLSPFLGGSTTDDPYDGGPSGRGKIAEGQNEVPAYPEASLGDGRYQGYGGLTSSSSGQTHVPVFDVPRGPLVSLGQLQHAQFSRYQYEPALPFGNSYASTRIPPDKTKVENYMEMENFTMLDISYGLNDALWDNYFFSTIGRDYIAPDSTAPLDSVLDFSQLAAGSQTLPNPRYTLRPQPGDSTFQELLEQAGENGPSALAARIHIEGAFNVNSTSVEAWKAVLSSMADFKFPVISTDGSSVSWADPKGIRFPRFGHVLAENGWNDGDGPLSKEFWHGYRKLSDTELDSLASEIVNEVRERGPFRSFADFVNRDPDSTDINHQRKGALQAALDRAINSSLNDDDEIGPGVTTPPVGSQFSQVQDEESQAAGFAGYLMQGDVLQSLAPVMQVRSDTFRIRAMGQSLDASGNVLARATCEALIQRNIDYVDPVNPPETRPDHLTSTANQRFGRRFEIVSFRWLAPEEL